jgi:hypothetical protein
MERAQDPGNAVIFKQFEEACSDFQVHWTTIDLPLFLRFIYLYIHIFLRYLQQEQQQSKS